MSTELRKLSINDGEDIYKMLQILPTTENGFVNSVNGLNYEEYKAWLVKQVNSSLQECISADSYVPQTTYWLYENGQPVGYGKIRHFLTDKLRVFGGNVGYSIIPSARNKGLGKKLLKLLIDESNTLKVDELLLTIKTENKASLSVALANGGIIEKIDNGRYYVWLKK